MSNFFVRMFNKNFEKKYLKEMAEPRSKIVNRIESQYDALIEHAIKAFVFRNDANNYKGYVNTVANILNYCNGQFAKTKTGKLKEKEYLELLFGINDTYSVVDARNQLWTFQMQKGSKYPKFERSEELIDSFYKFYSYLSHYFSDFLAKDKEDIDRLEEFEKIVDKFIKQS